MANKEDTSPATKADIERLLDRFDGIETRLDRHEEMLKPIDASFRTVLQHIEARADEIKEHVDESVEKLENKLEGVLNHEQRLTACERRLGLAV